MRGFLPQRLGKFRLAAIPKPLKTFTDGVQGTAIWLGSDGQLDTLLVLARTHLYTIQLDYKTSGATPAFQYDLRQDGQHSKIQLGSATDQGVFGATGSVINFSVQMKSELIFAIDTLLYRYYRDEPAGTEHLYQIPSGSLPGAPSLAGTTGGSLTASATYSYLVTYEDELGRETSPSATTSVTLSVGQNAVNVSRTTSTPPNPPYSTWNIYRLNPGGTAYLFVTNQAASTPTYKDVASDSSIAANDAAPQPGQNDFPSSASIGTVWRDRLVLNDVFNPANIQISNSGSPVQFSTLSLPTVVTDGLTTWVGGKGDNEITGFAELGGMLAIFKRSSMTFLQGDTIENFSLLPVHERGCCNPNSIQRCENVIIFASNDGIYTILYENGYLLRKISLEIEDVLAGFMEVTQPGEPTSWGQPGSVEVLTAAEPLITSFYSRNRYYLSYGNKTLCYDLAGKGWSDTGWGFLNTAIVYKSQQADRGLMLSFPPGYLGAPETVILSRGDIHSGTTTTTQITLLEYFTAVDTVTDPDFPAFPPGFVFATLKTRFYDGDGPPQNRRKRAKRFILYGFTNASPGTTIGTLKGYVGRDLRCIYPIKAWQHIEKNNSLYEQELGALMIGEELYFQLDFTTPDLVLGNSILEYTFLN